MIKLTVNALVKFPLSVGEARQLAKIAARQEKKIRGEIELIIIGATRMRRLNHHYRGQNRVTDVLAFPWLETGKQKFLGQIFICAPQISRQAKDFEVPVRQEFSRMLIHGLLHLVGYNHKKSGEAKKMFGLQERILQVFGFD